MARDGMTAEEALEYIEFNIEVRMSESKHLV
jgi:hypothetical protein